MSFLPSSRHGCHQPSGAEVTVQIPSRQQRHRLTSTGGGAADVRQQYDVVEFAQSRGYVRFVGVDVQARAGQTAEASRSISASWSTTLPRAMLIR